MRIVTLSLVAVGLTAARWAAAEDVSVQASVTPAGNQWHYAYTLTNVSAADALVLLSLTRPGPNSISGITVPGGWEASNDDDTYVDFIALGTGLAVGSGPLAGFGYTTAVTDPVSFQAFDASGNLYRGSVPVTNAVPEPGSLALIALATPALLAGLRRRLGYFPGATHERG